MFDHIGFRTKDLRASVAFYAAALKPLGSRLLTEDESSAGFGESDPALWVYAADRAGAPVHLAFKARSRDAVDAFYAEALAAGGHENGLPGVRADYAPSYYAAFVLDPDGNNVEAVCLEARG